MSDDNGTLVAGAIILNAKKNRILLTQRQFNDRFGPGLWECPGGKVEGSEIEMQALARELYEEIGLIYETLPLRFKTIAFSAVESAILFGGTRRIEIAFYFVHAPDDFIPTLTEVAGAGWFTLAEALHLPLTPGTQCVLQDLEAVRYATLRRQGY
jgi:8-oxo-dGTP diphosphatase